MDEISRQQNILHRKRQTLEVHITTTTKLEELTPDRLPGRPRTITMALDA